MKKVNKFFTYEVMFYSLILVYEQFMTMLAELQKVLSQELKCLFNNITTVLLEWILPKPMDVSYIFIALQINKHTV
jgi:hypothetical protein